MSDGWSMRVVLLLLALATVGVTALITLVAMLPRDTTPDEDTPTPVMAGGAQTLDVRIALPEFTLTDQHGQPFGTEQLDGRPWIASFVFTHCTGTCPRITDSKAKLQQQLQSDPRYADVMLVSISVDPSRDTPQVLRDYATLYGADQQRWRMLTGEREEIWELIGRKGFKESVFDNIEDARMPIGHSSNFVLVDRHRNIRGYYSGIDMVYPDGSVRNHERDELLHRLDALLQADGE